MMFVILIVLVLLLAGVYIIFVGSLNSRVRQARQTKFYKKLYKFFSNFFLTQSYLSLIYSKLANLSVYKKDELQVLSAKYLLLSWGLSLALVVSSFFLFEDMLTILICVLFAILLCTIIVDKQLDALHEKVLKALSVAIGSIRQEYLKSGDIVVALNDADVPSLLKKPMEEIGTILISTNAELRLQEFCEATPYRTIQTLAAVCYHINNQGDEVDAYGQSSFVQALTLMLSDVNSEIQKITYRKKKFGIIEYLPFIPIFAIGLIESYFISIIPGTALIYNGTLGFIFKTVTVLASAVCYVIVSRVNSIFPIKEDDRSPIVMSLLDRPRLKKFVRGMTPRGKRKLKVEKALKEAISRMSMEHLYMKKVLYALCAFVLSLTCIMSSISLGSDFIRNSTQQLSLVATNEMSKYSEESIRKMDETYLANPDSFNDQQIESLVRAYMPGLSDLQVQDQIKRLKDKAKSLKGAYFRWWYIWICFGVGVIGWFIPNIGLMFRKTLIRTEEEDDFLQLQTLVSILMNTNLDTLDILYQMSQHSRVHRDMFLYAYQGYPSNPELEIARMQSKTNLVEFKRFLGKLKMTISDLSIKEVYSDLLIEREHILRMRDMILKASIDKRRQICGPLSLTPMALMVIGEFITPIGLLGFNEFMNVLSSLGS